MTCKYEKAGLALQPKYTLNLQLPAQAEHVIAPPERVLGHRGPALYLTYPPSVNV